MPNKIIEEYLVNNQKLLCFHKIVAGSKAVEWKATGRLDFTRLEVVMHRRNVLVITKEEPRLLNVQTMNGTSAVVKQTEWSKVIYHQELTSKDLRKLIINLTTLHSS